MSQTEKEIAPEPAETTFHSNNVYLVFTFLKPVQKAICGEECQTFNELHPTVNFSK